MSWLSRLLGDVTGGLIPDEIKELYTTPLTQITSPDITFQPFTVTGTTGTTTTGADGSTTYALNAQQQALQDMLFGGASSFYQQAQMPTAARESDVYERIRATQRDEETRQNQLLQDQLASQGRLGVTTSQYGGTPEQLAMAKARAEAMNTASLGAMQQAQAEQMQQASLAGQFMQQGYAPQASLLSALSPALNVAGMADVARRQQGEFDLETAMSNLTGEMGLRTGYGNLYGNVYGGLLGGLGGLLAGGKKPWWIP
jgi:hypothetical protein